MPVSQDIAKLGSEMLEFVTGIDDFNTPDAVLNGLHEVARQACALNVLGAALFPLRWGDWSDLIEGKTVFLHKSAPQGWWGQHIDLSRDNPGPGFMLAQVSLAPFTMSELMRMVEPLGVDRLTPRERSAVSGGKAAADARPLASGGATLLSSAAPTSPTCRVASNRERTPRELTLSALRLCGCSRPSPPA
jgi:hypothetical protein